MIFHIREKSDLYLVMPECSEDPHVGFEGSFDGHSYNCFDVYMYCGESCYETVRNLSGAEEAAIRRQYWYKTSAELRSIIAEKRKVKRKFNLYHHVTITAVYIGGRWKYNTEYHERDIITGRECPACFFSERKTFWFKSREEAEKFDADKEAQKIALATY